MVSKDNQINVHAQNVTNGLQVSTSNVKQVISATNNKAQYFADLAKKYKDEAKKYRDDALYYSQQNYDVTFEHIETTKIKLENKIDEKCNELKVNLENKIPKNLFINTDDIVEYDENGNCKLRDSYKDVKHYVFIDDLCGSGDQATSNTSNVKRCVQHLRNIVEDAKISYRETIKGFADVEGRYVKQSGGSGQYGIVKIKFEHSDKDLEFVDDIFGGSVPGNYIPAVQKGLEDSMKSGVLAGFPVIGLKATLYDGKYHPVDSSELAFKMAASFAFKDGCKQAKPTILEPIMEIQVVAPNDYVGDIMGDLSKRRGLIMGTEPVGEESYITAEVPQVELAKYIIDLKTMTQAQATFTMKFIRYSEVPNHLVDKIIADNKKD
jgi:hypothetical protein